MENKQIMTIVSADGLYWLRNFADLDSIEEKIDIYAESILPRINTEDLPEGWSLILQVNCQCTDRIAINKKLYQYPSPGEYGITIEIPIPDATQAPYGLPLDEDGTIGHFYRAESGSAYLLDPEYDKYANLEQYILVSAITAIELGLSKGFPCNGKELKFSRLIDTPPLIPPHSKDVIKHNQVRARVPIEVPELDNFVDIDSINERINNFLETIPSRINIEDLWGWRLSFRINSFCTDLIAIYKKIWVNETAKEYIIPIAIPLPDNTQAPYGLPPGGNGRSGAFPPVESDHFYPLAPEYDKYVSLEQYIIVSAIKAIDFGLTKGFPRNGKSIKYSDSRYNRRPPRREFVIKYKQVRERMPIEVPRLGDFADISSINKKINTYVDSILPRINTEVLSGWRLFLLTNYACTDFIGVDKELKQYAPVREYGVSITIPIPDNTQAPYGVLPDKDGKIGHFHPGKSKYSHLLDPEYDKYVNLEQYIIAAAIKAIDFGFTKGFNCDGKEIKFQDLWRLANYSPPHINSQRGGGLGGKRKK
ncbi:Imm9 family immunity protein [Cephaloticoccus capnophilus]|uniref:Imm9 family immunity protein n=1 Tax=Cephaloticoccus capnophilus TaxID=1548208 RepID=UPI0009EF25C1|nr:Imm9 family immunity protein [Cephaloticoccus capnophilus]